MNNIVTEIADTYLGMLREAKLSDPKLLNRQHLLNQEKEKLAKMGIGHYEYTCTIATSAQECSGKFDEMKDTMIV